MRALAVPRARCGAKALCWVILLSLAGSVWGRRSDESLAQEKMMKHFFTTTGNWGTDVPPWEVKGWCHSLCQVLSCTTDQLVTKISLSNLDIEGALPEGFFAPFKPSLVVFRLWNLPKLNGSSILPGLLEAEMDVQLKTLALDGVQINSPIPSTYRTRGKDGWLLIRNCGLVGPIPATLILTIPKYLDLSSNALEGPVKGLDPYGLPHIESLDLSDNRLSGEFDGTLLYCTHKAIRIVGNGMLTVIPPEPNPYHRWIVLAEYITLENMDLTGVQAAGLPNFLHSQFARTVEISIYDSTLGGGMPDTLLCHTVSLEKLSLVNTGLSGTLPTCKYYKSQPKPVYLDISGNDFSGHFPPMLVDSDMVCDVTGNRFLCPCPAECKGGCTETCYNNGMNPLREQPCQCISGFHGDNCELYDLPGGGRLNCTASQDAQSLAICGPRPKGCNLCPSALSDDRICAGLDITLNACVHGQCEFDASTGTFTCICESDYEGSTCAKRKSMAALFSWIIVSTLALAACLLVSALTVATVWQQRKYRTAKSQRDNRITELEEGLLKAVEMNESAKSELDIASISVVEVLGEGASARVFLVRWQGKPAVLKQYREQMTYCGGFAAERTMFESLRHPHIVRYWGYVETPPCILMEYCEGGSLYDAIHRYNTCHESILSSNASILMFALDIARGLLYLHTKDVVHRDVKSLNILVSMGRAKIADFDAARRIQFEGGMTLNMGTIRWMAPEVIGGGGVEAQGKYGPAVDIWSFGCVFWEMYSREIPYSRLGWDTEVAQAITSGMTPMSKGEIVDDWVEMDRQCTRRIPEAVKDLLYKCWDYNPAARPTSAELVDALEGLVSDGFLS